MTRKVTIGQNRGKARLWIEGSWLTGFGFVRGAVFHITIADGRLIIRLGSSDEHRSRKVSGKGDRPIIDIVGEILTPLVGKDLILTASAGRLIIAERSGV